MKRTLALSFALSILTATGAFASTSPTSTVVATATQAAERSGHTLAEVRVVGAGNKTFDRAEAKVTKNVLVAENRKEFGSQYQRY